MKKNKNIDVKGISITVNKRGTDEFICITDIAQICKNLFRFGSFRLCASCDRCL
jgi:hypothetical protein